MRGVKSNMTAYYRANHRGLPACALGELRAQALSVWAPCGRKCLLRCPWGKQGENLVHSVRLRVSSVGLGFALAMGCSPHAAACSMVFPGHFEVLKSTRTIEGLRFPAGTEVEVLNAGNTATGVVVLKRKLRVDGHWLQPGTRLSIGASKGGVAHLLSFDSEPGQRINGIRLPAGSFVEFDAQGRLASINEYGGTVSNEKATIRVQGLAFLSSAGIAFHPNGRVKSGTLTQTFTAPGLSVGPASVTFDPNGHIASARDGGDTSVHARGVEYSGSYPVEFYPDGQVKSGQAMQDFVAGGLRAHRGISAFYPNGALKYGDVAQAFAACGLRMDAWMTEFYPNGCVKSGGLAQAIVRRGLHFGTGEVAFYPDGSVKEGDLTQAAVIHGVRVEPGKTGFYPDGRVQSRYASQNFVAHGVLLKSGIVKLFPDGSVEHGGVAHAATVRGLHVAPGAIEFYPDGRVKTANAVNGSVYRGVRLDGTPAEPSPFVQLDHDGTLQNPPRPREPPRPPPPVC